MSVEKPKTLLEFANAPAGVFDPEKAALILVDYQREYIDGKLALPDGPRAIQAAARLAQVMRNAGAPIFHIVHQGKPGGALFDPETPMADIAEPLGQMDGEALVTKSMPNAFAGTNLEELLRKSGREQFAIAGFMTHMCVESTARAASEKGFASFVFADACASRDLPHPTQAGETIPARAVHESALAALSDRFATIVPKVSA